MAESTRYEHLDRLRRADLGQWQAAAEAVDDWLHREHGITSGNHALGHLFDLLADAGYTVTPSGPPIPEQHLWDITHPYYGAEGNVFESPSWAAFIADGGDDIDPDYNHLYRWDWHRPNPEWGVTTDRLSLHFVMQRKSDCYSCVIAVTEADEPAIRAWLADKAQHVAVLWSPMRIPETDRG